MVIGDPYVVAVIYEYVKEWNADTVFMNGTMAFSIDGNLFPGVVLNVGIRRELKWLSENLEAIPQNDEVYGLEKSICFAKLYDMIFPEDWDVVDDQPEYNISPSDFSDQNYYIFAVGSGDKVRLFYAKLKYDFSESRHYWEDTDIQEYVVDREVLNKIAARLKNLTDADLLMSI